MGPCYIPWFFKDEKSLSVFRSKSRRRFFQRKSLSLPLYKLQQILKSTNNKINRFPRSLHDGVSAAVQGEYQGSGEVLGGSGEGEFDVDESVRRGEIRFLGGGRRRLVRERKVERVCELCRSSHSLKR